MTIQPRAHVAVLVTTGGVALDRTIAGCGDQVSVVAVDPLGRSGRSFGGVPVLDAVAAREELGRAPVLGLIEGEVASAELLGSLSTAGEDACRVRVCHRGRGWSLEPRRGAPRWGRWGGGRFGFEGADQRRRGSELPGHVLAEHGDVESSLRGLDAIGDAVAAVLDAEGAAVGLRLAVASVARQGLGAITARSERRTGWGRWVGAVLLAYGDVLAYAKLLERRGRR